MAHAPQIAAPWALSPVGRVAKVGGPASKGKDSTSGSITSQLTQFFDSLGRKKGRQCLSNGRWFSKGEVVEAEKAGWVDLNPSAVEKGSET
jgi:hypothetical protein